MFLINCQPRIDVKQDSIYLALLKKSNNTSLSPKTLRKLAKVAMASTGMSKSDARKLFIKNEPVNQTTSSILLSYDLTQVLEHISNDEIRAKLNEFIHHCGSSFSINSDGREIPCSVSSCAISKNDFIKENSGRIGSPIGNGTEAIIVEDNKNPEKLFKIFFDDVQPAEIINQANLFMKFYGENSVRVVSSGIIQLDKIDGTPLSQVTFFLRALVINLSHCCVK